MPDFLFTEFPSQNINANTALVITSGRTAKGSASASYVSDSLANAALYAAHPRFVGQSANGRYFRALPVGGVLPVELGGAIGDGLANDQPAIQASITYAEAVGARVIQFQAASYRLHCPVRTSDPAPAGEHFYDGRPLVVSTALVMRSVRNGGSRLVFRHVDGSERSSYQLVASASVGQPQVWRGGGIFLKCPSVMPTNYADRPALTLEDITLDGGLPRTEFYGWPARSSDGDGWDITDKGIWVEADRWSGDIRLIRSTVSGFRGEVIFQAGRGNGELYIRSGVLGDTNGNLFQSCGTNLDIDGLLGYNAFQAFEGWSGRRGRMVNAVFEDCIATGGLSGGRLADSGSRNTPTRFTDGETPWLSVDAEFRNCGSVMFGSWVRGEVKLTDSTLTLDGAMVYAEGLHDVDLEVVAQADKRTGQPAVVLMGSDLPGRLTLSDLRLRLRCTRTEQARLAGRCYGQPVDYRGSIGPGVFIEQSSGETGRASGPSGNHLTAITDHYPCFRGNRWRRINNDWAAIDQNVELNPQIVPRADLMGVVTDTPGTWPITLPVSGIQHGHELTIRNLSGANRFVTLAAAGAGAALAATRTLAPAGQIVLRFDEEIGLWRETAAPPG